jgi:hypothetical protein
MSYDHNGLELTSMGDTMNTYKFTAVNLKEEKYSAYAQAKQSAKKEFSMHPMKLFKDPRDAAFVGQMFNKKYSKEQIAQMYLDGTFREIANKFIENLEIPEWQFSAEGLTVEEIKGGGYNTNYVDNAREALVEAIRVLKTKTPDLKSAKSMMEKVEKLYKGGMTYRQAAHQIVKEM